MHIIFLIKGSLERNVPVITQITIALQKGNAVGIICTDCEAMLRRLLEDRGAKIYCSEHPVLKAPVIRKVSDWLGVRKKFGRLLKQIYKAGDLLYVGSLDTALAVGRKLMGYTYILHIRELYDRYPYYIRLIKPYAQSSGAVITPEYCRAAILKCWLGLERMPVVVPNKPYEHPRERNVKIEDESIQKKINGYCGKKIILYQGIISRDRGIDKLIETVLTCIDESYVLVLMGSSHGNYMDELVGKYPRISHIEYIPAPFHLQITSHAHIGLVTYDDSCLNNLFCAPNKIYEYCGFGIPVLGRDIPGLRHTIGDSGAGICVDFCEVEEVARAIGKIESNYGVYKNKANELFDSIDMGGMFDRIIDRVYSNGMNAAPVSYRGERTLVRENGHL